MSEIQITSKQMFEELKEIRRVFNEDMSSMLKELNSDRKENQSFREEVKVALAEMPEKVVKITDEKYASKLTENVVYTMLGIILISVLGAIITGAIGGKASLTESDIIKLIKNEQSQDQKVTEKEVIDIIDKNYLKAK